MRAFQVAAEDRGGFHAAGHGDEAEGNGLSRSDRAVVATQAELAGTVESGLQGGLMIGCAAVEVISLYGQLLVPQRRGTRHCSMGRVAIETGVGEIAFHLASPA